MERHTRQGDPRRAVTEVRGLDEYEEPDYKPKGRARGGAKQNLRTISVGGCWCGKPVNHTWPGRGEGAPHPR